MSRLSVLFIIFLASAISQDNRNTCLHMSTSQGKCVISNECATNPKIDKSDCDGSKICCPIGKRSNKAGKKESEKLGNFTFAVALGYKAKYGILWKCGGVLIAENAVLTAASCVKRRGLPQPTIVKTAIHEEIPIKSVIINSKYDGVDFDLSKLILAKESLAPKGCITSKKTYGKDGMAVGFGSLSQDNMLHGTVYKAPGAMNVRIEGNGNKKFITQIDGKRCFADHGGALITLDEEESCKFPVVGIISKWKDCDEPKSRGYFTETIK